MFERRLEPGQVSALTIAFAAGRLPVEVLGVTDMVVEAPIGLWTAVG
jgi:hypothetical protein